ncbi:alpha/beta hydrolase [Oscillibacter valericigenes]|nr:alpha/beta hydrolase [Oscillibacter valericigenes]
MRTTNILVHGLGQNETGWSLCRTELERDCIEAEAPNLYAMVRANEADYAALLQGFTDYCNAFDGRLNLCGLSLGGILALDYAKRFPDRVHSMILIGVPYRIPRFLFAIQSAVFRLMPSESFEKMGIGKKELISLVHSMRHLELASGLETIRCKVLLLCGAKDRQNKKDAKMLCEEIKGSSFQIVRGAAHEVNTDNPKVLAEIIGSFWQQVEQ